MRVLYLGDKKKKYNCCCHCSKWWFHLNTPVATQTLSTRLACRPTMKSKEASSKRRLDFKRAVWVSGWPTSVWGQYFKADPFICRKATDCIQGARTKWRNQFVCGNPIKAHLPFPAYQALENHTQEGAHAHTYTTHAHAQACGENTGAQGGH